MKRVLVQVDDGMHEQWKQAAASYGVSMSEIVRRLLEQMLKPEEKKKGV